MSSENNHPKVLIISEQGTEPAATKACSSLLEDFGVKVFTETVNAKDLIVELNKYASKWEEMDVIIVVTYHTGYLSGIIASATVVPVIALPLMTDGMNGLDNMITAIRVPRGVSVASVAIDGADNAALLAVRILSVSYLDLRVKLKEYRANMESKVIEKAKAIKGSRYM